MSHRDFPIKPDFLSLDEQPMADLRSTERFSNRVDDYVRYRPDYPAALLEWIQDALGVDTAWPVADIGAGTGISSKMFLDAGYTVTAVEPNAPMRAAAQAWLHTYARFRSVDGRADATTLPPLSTGLISVAQAFHWFDPVAARHEFKRILRPGGLAVIYWNSRRLDSTPFLRGYEDLLLAYGTDYTSVAERYADEAAMRAWFGKGWRGTAKFEHKQLLDFEALKGRLMSSSYAPKEDHPNHAPMLAALRDLFEHTQLNGKISFDYDTRVYAGEVT